ncbi:MAG: helix-turn-helix domain-containing protein, partial [Candidatus Enteromonas sp.]
GRFLLTLEDAQSTLPVFEASFDALCLDNPGIEKALIIPSTSPCFFEGLELLGAKELDTYGHLCLAHPELLDSAMALLEPLSPEEVEAAYAYIKCGESPSAAGLGIYAHKNTVCNRVKRFVQKTGIDLSLFSNQLFVYLLGNEWKKTLQRG